MASDNLSSLYQLDAFDWTVLVVYFGILSFFAILSSYYLKTGIEFWRHRSVIPKPKEHYGEEALPKITVQLPTFNELYVIERLLAATTKLEYPRDKFEIQVLDDSTDETVNIARATVENYAKQGYDIHYIHRSDRQGFRAGALANGLEKASGELLVLFDADFVPAPDFVRKLIHYFTDPVVGCVQMRWTHINGSYNLLTRMQTTMLDSRFVIDQTRANHVSGVLELNGTAAIWRRKAVEMVGGWQPNTLCEDTDLSLRARLMGWKFVYLLDEFAAAEIPVEMNAFKAQQRRLTKGAIQVAIKLYSVIARRPIPLRSKIEMFLCLMGSVTYPVIIIASFVQFPLLLVRYNLPYHQLMLLDMPLLLFLLITLFLRYASAIFYLDNQPTRRLLEIPLVLGLNLGLAFSNSRAVLEAIAGFRTEFVRTPKYRVELATDASWKRKKYKRRHGWLPLLELSFAVYFLLSIFYALKMGMWLALPVLVLLLFGFAYTGLMSLLPLSISRFWLTSFRAQR